MEVIYNVKQRFKDNKNLSEDSLKEIINKKLINIIIILEKQNKFGLNKS